MSVAQADHLKDFGPAYFEALHNGAAASPRARQHGNVQASHQEPCQRLFIALRPESYVPPHRHLLDPKQETLIAISGLMAFVTFHDDGEILDIMPFGSEAYGGGQDIPIGVDLPPNLWHSVVTLSESAALFEAKQRPCRVELGKEHAFGHPRKVARALPYI